MHIHRLLALVLLGLSLSATAADFRTVTEVYEIDLVNARMPATEGGTLAIKQCDDCDAQLLRATAATRYVLNKQNVTLAEFKNALISVTNRKDVIIDVFHHLESDTVTAVKVKL